MEGRFDLRPYVKHPHLGATTLPNLEAKSHLGAIRNELDEMSANYHLKISYWIEEIFHAKQ